MMKEALPQALTELDPTRQQAVTELARLISSHYPSARFALRTGIDDPGATYLTATVDIEDPDAVLDIVEERLLALQLDEGIPIYVLPVHTPARVADTIRRVRKREPAGALQPTALP
jgi:hypothetical protein